MSATVVELDRWRRRESICSACAYRRAGPSGFCGDCLEERGEERRGGKLEATVLRPATVLSPEQLARRRELRAARQRRWRAKAHPGPGQLVVA